MLQFFRNLANSKVGLGFLIGFVVLMMLSFSAGDISNFLTGATTSGDSIAAVGGEKITSDEVRQSANSALEAARKEDPKASMKALLAGDGYKDLIDSLVDRSALLAFGADHGMSVSPALVAREINKIGAFRGPDGNFSESLYRQMLQQRGLTDARVRQDIAASLISKQILVPAAFGARFPEDMARRYSTLLRERRTGAIALLPSSLFAPSTPPSDAELQAFYTRTRATYERPERRVIRYASFGEDAIKNVPAPTEAEIAARYQANRETYAASESRKLTQLILPTEAAARAILAEIQGGKTMEAAAATKGLAAATLEPLTRAALSSQSSSAVADASFAAARGTIAGPVRSGLGWHLMRVDSVEGRAARSLDQVRGEITTALAAEKKRKALNDFTGEVEDEFQNGGSLADVAEKLGVTISTTEPLTVDGAVYGKPGQQAPAELARVLPTAFSAEREGSPEIAEIETGKTFLVFEVSSITAAAPPPLAEVREQVLVEYAMQHGATQAKAAADRMVAAAGHGQTLAAFMASLHVAGLPPVDTIEMSREQLAQRQQNVPPPLRLLFSMAERTIKLLPAPRNRGWYVVQLSDIVPGTVPANDPMVVSVQRELAQSSGRELAEQLRAAVREEVGVDRNEAAMQALARTLTGAGN